MRKVHRIYKVFVLGLLFVALFSVAINYAGHRKLTHADPNCTVTVSSLSAIATAASSATGGSTICVAAGTYDGELTLAAQPSSDIIIQPVPGSSVTLGNSDQGVGIAVDFASNAKHIILRNFYLTSEISIEAGASDITIDHNDITGGYYGIAGGGVDCEAPNAPVYGGCTTTPTINNITVTGNKLHGFGYTTNNTSGIDWPINHHTPPLANSEDALHFNHFDGLHISANEISGVEEGGNHSDCLQTVWGGNNLTFDHNYLHDNQCQGFFLKDGDVTNVSVTNNLFLRDYTETHDQANLQVFNTSPITIRNNTFWELQGNLVRADSPSFNPPLATVDHNVFMLFNSLTDTGPSYQLTEDYDILRTDPYTFIRGAHSILSNSPPFTDPATDNYELSSNPNGIGVDWHPSEYTYGPLPTTTTPDPGTNGSDGGGDNGTPSAGGTSTPATSGSSSRSKVSKAVVNTLKAAAAAKPTATAKSTQPGNGLTISDIKIDNIGQHSATVSWQTNEPASSVVAYGRGNNLNLSEKADGLTQTHSVQIDSASLKPGLQYSVRLTSVNAAGQQAVSPEVSFKTLGLTVTFTVTDSKGKPIEKANVSIAGQTKLTDEKGKATFNDLPYGSQTVTVDYKDQRTVSQAVLGDTVSGGEYKAQTVAVPFPAVKSGFTLYTWLAGAAVLVAAAAIVGAAVFYLRSPKLPPTTSNIGI